MHIVSGKRVVATEQEVMWFPRNWSVGSQDTNPYGVLFVHGNGDFAVSPMDITNKTGQFELVESITSAGLPVLTMDFGQIGVTPNGLNGWGNATVLARIASAFAFMTADPDSGGKFGAKPGKFLLLGVSMGFIGVANYAKANSEFVAGAVGIIPAVSLADFYNNDRAGLRSGVETAHGVVHPAALPAGSDPMTAAGEMVDVSTRLYGSSADTVTLSSLMVDYGELIDAEVIIHSTTLEHSEASIRAIDMKDLVSWMLART